METIALADRPGLHIDGFPNAVKVLALKGPVARRIADLALHRGDLLFARDCLEQVNRTPEEPALLRHALWRSAIVHFAKCYGDSTARSQLSPKKVLRGEAPVAIEVFEYFKALRNKHVVHDENPLAQSLPGAILNARDQPRKIEKIISLSLVAETLGQEHYSNLHLLIQKSLTWVEKEFDRLCLQLTTELEAIPYEQLLAMPAPEYRAPEADSVHARRDAI
jgi:hypothetical protein